MARSIRRKKDAIGASLLGVLAALGFAHILKFTSWGELSGDAERTGTKIPVLGGLLAATALQAGLTLVTDKLDHFRQSECSVLSPWER